MPIVGMIMKGSAVGGAFSVRALILYLISLT